MIQKLMHAEQLIRQHCHKYSVFISLFLLVIFFCPAYPLVLFCLWVDHVHGVYVRKKRMDL